MTTTTTMCMSDILEAARAAFACHDGLAWAEAEIAAGSTPAAIAEAMRPKWVEWLLQHVPVPPKGRGLLLIAGAATNAYWAADMLRRPGAAAPWSPEERAMLIASAATNACGAVDLLRHPDAAAPLSPEERLMLIAGAATDAAWAADLLRYPGAAAPFSAEEEELASAARR